MTDCTPGRAVVAPYRTGGCYSGAGLETLLDAIATAIDARVEAIEARHGRRVTDLLGANNQALANWREQRARAEALEDAVLTTAELAAKLAKMLKLEK